MNNFEYYEINYEPPALKKEKKMFQLKSIAIQTNEINLPIKF